MSIKLMTRLADLHTSLRSFVVVGGLALVCSLIIAPVVCAQTEQARDQCRKCCETKGLDEYYLEQCKLKCFRAPEHCAGTSPGAPTSAARETPPPSVTDSTPAAEPRPRVRQPAPSAAREAPSPAQPMRPPGGTEAPPLRQEAAPRPGGFTWPSPLNLVPGREWEAAGQILSVNGIPPQHPNAQRALAAIEAVLKDFARSNPQGGQLPTAALEQIIRQNR